MDELVSTAALSKVTARLVDSCMRRAEDLVRPFSVVAEEGAEETYLLDGVLSRLKRRAPAPVKAAAMVLHATAVWQDSLNRGNPALIAISSLTLGAYIQEANLATELKKVQREASSRGGGKGKWNSKCDQIVIDEFPRLRRSPALSKSKISKQLAAIIQRDAKVEIQWRQVMVHLRRLKLIEPAKVRTNSPRRPVARK